MRAYIHVFVAGLALAGCADSGPTDPAQAAVPQLVDCGRLNAGLGAYDARSSVESDRTPLPADATLKLRLLPVTAVRAAFHPGRKEKSADMYAGLVPVRVEASGTYALLSASIAWVDLGETGPPRRIEPQSFDWIRACGTRFKSGLYRLEAERAYVVQLWDSPDRELILMIRRLP